MPDDSPKTSRRVPRKPPEKDARDATITDLTHKLRAAEARIAELEAQVEAMETARVARARRR